MNKHDEHDNLRFWHGIWGASLAFAGYALLVMLLIIVQKQGIWTDPPAVLLVSGLGISGVFIIVSLHMYRTTTASLSQSLTVNRGSRRHYALAVAGTLPAGVVVDQVMTWLIQLKPDIFSPSHLTEIGTIVQDVSALGFIGLLIVMCVLPAIGEELLFRGVVFKGFCRDMPVAFAVIYSSFLFGLIHLDWLQGTAAFLLGGYLAMTYAFTGSLLAPMGGHFLNNLVWTLSMRYFPDKMDDIISSGYPMWCTTISVGLVAGALYLMKRNSPPCHHSS